MKVHFSPFSFAPAFVSVLALYAPALVAQTNIQLFGPLDGAQSLSTATYSTPYGFNTTTLNLTCPASGIVASLSGPATNSSGTAPIEPLEAGGRLLVDNNIFVSVAPLGGSFNTPVNVCPATNYQNGGEGVYTNNCFTSGYQGIAGELYGDDPDMYELNADGPTADYAGGVAPINISSLLLTTGAEQSMTIALDDEGGSYIGSSIFLTTNCTQGAVTGPAQVSGNPITTGSSPQGTTQTFTFDTTTGQQIGLVYDITTANTDNTLTGNTNGPSPIGGDSPVDPKTFQSTFVPHTSFATSKCLIHTGEALADGDPACKLYTLECSLGNSAPAGALCPVSSVANEVIEDIFDGPNFDLHEIHTPDGQRFHEGIGLLMASDDWSATDGGNCTFDAASGLTALPCPQNLLISFSGPGGFGGLGQTTNPNSTFISLYGVPEDLTWVNVEGASPFNWVNTSTPRVRFKTEAPDFTKGAWTEDGRRRERLRGAEDYIPAPIQSLTYGLSAADNQPLPINEPITGDTVLTSDADCSGGHFTARRVHDFAPPTQKLASMPDGKYLLHYYAEDCAGTQELQFTKAPVTGSWSTTFYTYPVNIDTTAPVIHDLEITSEAPYRIGSTVFATYSCTDATTGSGVVACGERFYAPESTYDTHTLKTRLDTDSPGPHRFTVWALDGAGNFSSKSIDYTVVR